MPFVRTHDGHKLHVRVIGEGPPCVLVHGFASDSRSFQPFLRPLLGRYRFVLPDLRGFGKSVAVPLGDDDPLRVYARDLGSVIAGLELGRPALGGISMGAFACLAHFRDFGEARARSYLHIDQGLVVHNAKDAPFGLMGPEQQRFFARLRHVLDELSYHEGLPFVELPEAVQSALFNVYGEFVGAAFGSRRLGAFARFLSEQRAVATRMLDVTHYPTLLTIMRAYLERRYDMRPVFGALRLPVHVLIGGASRMYPAEGQRRNVAALLPSARVTELPGVGHVVPIEAPRAFARTLAGYLHDAYA